MKPSTSASHRLLHRALSASPALSAQQLKAFQVLLSQPFRALKCRPLAHWKLLSLNVDRCHADIHHFNATNNTFCTSGQEFSYEKGSFVSYVGLASRCVWLWDISCINQPACALEAAHSASCRRCADTLLTSRWVLKIPLPS